MFDVFITPYIKKEKDESAKSDNDDFKATAGNKEAESREVADEDKDLPF
jgi:hypothetical protein